MLSVVPTLGRHWRAEGHDACAGDASESTQANCAEELPGTIVDVRNTDVDIASLNGVRESRKIVLDQPSRLYVFYRVERGPTIEQTDYVGTQTDGQT